ncbi:MAG: hypothetical protein AAGJ40_16530 [Planctomycetota bacterium]
MFFLVRIVASFGLFAFLAGIPDAARGQGDSNKGAVSDSTIVGELSRHDQYAVDLLEGLLRNNLSLERYDVSVITSTINEETGNPLGVVETKKRFISDGDEGRKMIVNRSKAEVIREDHGTDQRSFLQATIFGGEKQVFEFRPHVRRVMPVAANASVATTRGFPDFRFLGRSAFPRIDYEGLDDVAFVDNLHRYDAVKVLERSDTTLRIGLQGPPYGASSALVILEWVFDLRTLMPAEFRDYIGWQGKDERKLVTRERFSWKLVDNIYLPDQIVSDRLSYDRGANRELLDPPSVSYRTHHFVWHSVNKRIDPELLDGEKYSSVADFQVLVD